MKTPWRWLLMGSVAFLLVFLVTIPFFSGTGGGTGSMMGRGWSGWNMMGGGYPMMGFGFLMMAGAVLAPLILVGLALAAVVGLIQGSRRNADLPLATGKCPQCGQSVEKGWVACPHCGKPLK